jgi:hypothetical protein
MQADLMGSTALAGIGEVELVEELSSLTTQAARMRARMADIMAELDRRRQAASGGSGNAAPMGSHAAGSW